MTLEKPDYLHGRDREWATLSAFATDPAMGARLALVYGRRRQGKTMLLEALARAGGGFVFTGLPLTARQNLVRLSRAYAAFTGEVATAFADWEQAVDALMRLGERSDQPCLVVLDEFQYLMDGEPALPGFIQLALEPLGRAQTRSRTRLVLCGSALHVMRGLLGGSAPLRGRASREVMIRPFGFRDSADFWDLSADPQLAFQTHALLGGTPAYRGMAGAAPSSVQDFGRWVAEAPLADTSALFREGAVILHEDPELSDVGLYYAVLGAIARGSCRRGEIAAALGRSDQSLAHPLTVLEHTQLIERVDDAFRQRRPVYRITEPVIRLHQLLIAPHEPELVGGAAQQVWEENADTVTSKIYGPHFEEIARQWALWHASPETLGARASAVLSATLACRLHQQGHELDVVAIRRQPYDRDAVLAIGEVKSTAKPVGDGDLERLDHLRELIPADRYEEPPRLLLFARHGFTRELRQSAASRRDVELVDAERLYTGG
ncbi:hypothetical protein HDA40_005679 [Hamadaea flava]|uniref:ATP-binding protein n=1 Tax=Hamadaea flava TaxID=1742688 RepID=A0ABV8LRC0_9ACTN|nr:AAA family ATPase [Hamadaea flava]MCP2327172.1 hypothetical protein [Hamadaea flava]